MLEAQDKANRSRGGSLAMGTLVEINTTGAAGSTGELSAARIFLGYLPLPQQRKIYRQLLREALSIRVRLRAQRGMRVRKRASRLKTREKGQE